jgi:Tfp pilus assembly protein PilN
MSAKGANSGEKSRLSASGELPAPPAPRVLPRSMVVLWLITVSMAIFLLPLYIVATALNQDISGLQTDLDSLQASLASRPTAAPEVAQLLTPLAQVQVQTNQVNAVLPTLAAARADIPAVMVAIGNYDVRQIALTQVTRAGNQITVGGQATDDTVVVAYARSLEQSNLFSRVLIQSIQIADTTALTMTVTPTMTITPTATYTPIPLATATPDLRDKFEPDEARPAPISIAQPQLRNFFPDGDVDKSAFFAKSLHSYRVSTLGLAPGVDTVLTVRVGPFTFINDDAQPGSLNSQVVFQDNGPDAQAVITVTNRGQFGPDKSYTLVVEEVPSPAGAPLPTGANPTPTIQPTQTPMVVTATPPAIPTIIFVTATPPGSSAFDRTIRPAPRYVLSSFTIPPADFAVPSVGLLPISWPAVTNPTGLPPTARDLRAVGSRDSMPVKFVILLELKAASP